MTKTVNNASIEIDPGVRICMTGWHTYMSHFELKDGFFMTDHEPLDAPDAIAGGSAQSVYSETFKENRCTARTVSRDLLFLGY